MSIYISMMQIMPPFHIMSRSFATSTRFAQLVRPPIQVFGVDGRYANALFSAASKENQLPHVQRDMKLIEELFKQNGRISETLKSPIVTKQEKYTLLQNLGKEYELNPLTLNVFQAMSENGRLSLLPKLLKTFDLIMGASKGEILATVTTAKELNAKQQKEVQAALQNFVKAGQVLRIEASVDPSIIGGMIVSVGDRYVDMSTRSKIKLYSKIVEETI